MTTNATSDLLKELAITDRWTASVRLLPGKAPVIEMVFQPDVENATQGVFGLAPEPALDLDAMCEAARRRLAQALDESCEDHLNEHTSESFIIDLRLNRALDNHRWDAMRALRGLGGDALQLLLRESLLRWNLAKVASYTKIEESYGELPK